MNRQQRRQLSRSVKREQATTSKFLTSDHLTILNTIIREMKSIYLPKLDNLTVTLINDLESIFYDNNSIEFYCMNDVTKKPQKYIAYLHDESIMKLFKECVTDITNTRTMEIHQSIFELACVLIPKTEYVESTMARILYRDYITFSKQYTFENDYEVNAKFSNVFIQIHEVIWRILEEQQIRILALMTKYISAKYDELTNSTDTDITENKQIQNSIAKLNGHAQPIIFRKIVYNLAKTKAKDFTLECKFIVSVLKTLLTEHYINIFPKLLEEAVGYCIQEVIGTEEDFSDYKDVEDNNLQEDSSVLSDIANNVINTQTIKSEIENEEVKNLKYIDKYKDLNKVALNAGFIYKRSNGDHGIFENDKGNIILIPQGRTIGKGLSLAIQSQIIKNK